MGCSKCDNGCSSCNPCDKCCVQEECGCEFEVDSSCVRYTKKDLDCLGNVQGSTVEDIITAIDEKMCDITNGTDGDSAYEIAVTNGFDGTEEEWLESLKGTDGVDGICDCNDIKLYREDSVLDTVGVWTDVTDYTTASFLMPTGYTYTATEAGNYELTYKGVCKSTKKGVLTSAVFKNGVRYDPSIAIDLTGTEYYNTTTTNFLSNISLVVGDILTFQLSIFNDEGGTCTVNSNVLQIKKLI